jgi:hypothetical protein
MNAFSKEFENFVAAEASISRITTSARAIWRFVAPPQWQRASSRANQSQNEQRSTL